MQTTRPSSPLLRRRLNLVMTSWHKLIKGARDNYRPELHYMRGPGPKWNAKQQTRGEREAL